MATQNVAPRKSTKKNVKKTAKKASTKQTVVKKKTVTKAVSKSATSKSAAVSSKTKSAAARANSSKSSSGSSAASKAKKTATKNIRTETVRSWYDYPQLYELGFLKDTPKESKFLDAVFKKYVPFPVERVIELGCGSGRLVCDMATRGFKMTGLDLNPTALEYCQKKLKKLRSQRRNRRWRHDELQVRPTL